MQYRSYTPYSSTILVGERLFNCLGGSSCMVTITPNAPNLDHAKK